MDKQTKELWLDALRSGRYPQCRNALQEDGGFCCLGVLLVVTGHEATEEVPDADPEARCQTFAEYEELSASAQEFFGLTSSVYFDAIKRNDHGESFEQIADWLEDVL